MKRFLVFLLPVLVFAQSSSSPASSAQTRSEEIEQQRELMSRTPVSSDSDPIERTVVWLYNKKVIQFFTSGVKGFAPTAGGMVDYSGIPVGMQFLRTDLLNGNMVLRSSARVSQRGYQLYDFETGLPRLAHGKVYLDFYLRRRDYPMLDYYGPGQGSTRGGRTNYRLEDFEADVHTGIRPTSWLRVGFTGGFYRPNVGPGQASGITSTDSLFSFVQTPGIQRQTDFWRGGPLVQVDYRDNPYGPKSGGQYYGRLDYFQDRQQAGFTFRRITGEVQQFVPLFNRKRVIAVRARTYISLPNGGQRVPFYLQPSLGGSDDLRGYRPFRFYDNNSLVYNAEWRWEVLSGVDAALFFDAGKVFSQPGQLSFRHMATSYGAGVRVRAPVSGAVIGRFDIGVSREGWQVYVTFSDLFATPQIRTGRELSPPPGRLP